MSYHIEQSQRLRSMKIKQETGFSRGLPAIGRNFSILLLFLILINNVAIFFQRLLF
jgi:hypothetical protein